MIAIGKLSNILSLFAVGATARMRCTHTHIDTLAHQQRHDLRAACSIASIFYLGSQHCAYNISTNVFQAIVKEFNRVQQKSAKENSQQFVYKVSFLIILNNLHGWCYNFVSEAIKINTENGYSLAMKIITTETNMAATSTSLDPHFFVVQVCHSVFIFKKFH